MFEFPVRKISSWLASWLPHEPVITQKMSVMHNQKEVVLYAVVKRNYDLDGEYGPPLSFKFDPSVQPQYLKHDPYPSIYILRAP